MSPPECEYKIRKFKKHAFSKRVSLPRSGPGSLNLKTISDFQFGLLFPGNPLFNILGVGNVLGMGNNFMIARETFLPLSSDSEILLPFSSCP